MKLIKQMIQQYQAKHNRLPLQVLVHPVALTALALKKSALPMCDGVPIVCREVTVAPAVDSLRLGITVIDGAIRTFDI
jgi:hypothetical protein